MRIKLARKLADRIDWARNKASGPIDRALRKTHRSRQLFGLRVREFLLHSPPDCCGNMADNSIELGNYFAEYCNGIRSCKGCEFNETGSNLGS